MVISRMFVQRRMLSSPGLSPIKPKRFISSTPRDPPPVHQPAAQSTETVDGSVPAVNSTPRDPQPVHQPVAQSTETVDGAHSAVGSPLADGDDTVEYCVQSEGVLSRKTRAKKGHANKQEWKRNKAKQNRMSGKSYMGVHGNTYVSKQPRELGPRCCCKLSQKKNVLKCSEFNDDERQEIFNHFWEELTWDEKKLYVTSMVEMKSVKRRTGEDRDHSRRNTSLIFSFKRNGTKARVCKEFFLSTLNLGEWTLYSWVRKGDESAGGCSIPRLKSVRESRNQSQVRNYFTPRREFAVNFLNSLPKMESHYCRSTSSKMYLEPTWQSHSELYREYCSKATEAGIEPINRVTFVEIFNDLNLSLFSPKKDQCDICCAHESGNYSTEEYELHQCRKELARLEKQKDKVEKKNVFTMDLESVLLAPRLQASALYYKTKLCVHNFTIFDLKTKQGTCFVWHEGEGGLSANEFCTIVCKFVEDLATLEGDEVIIWSDGCTYQNRNATLANGLLSVAMKKKIIICQKFLVRGHTQMECDSMHSTIERRLRNCRVYVPADYVGVFEDARISPAPYTVHYIDHTFFNNYSTLNYYRSIRPGTKTGDPVVTDIVGLCYKPDGTVLFKLSFDEEWAPLPEMRACRRKNATTGTDIVQTLYGSSLPIKTEKFLHLQQLKTVIPGDYHNFYDNLHHVCGAAGSAKCTHIIDK